MYYFKHVNDYYFIAYILRNADGELTIYINNNKRHAIRFETRKEAEEYYQPLIDENHGSINNYVLACDGEDKNDAYDRAMGVI